MAFTLLVLLCASPALAQWEPAEAVEIRKVLDTMYSLVGVVKADWPTTETDRPRAAARMKGITMALNSANDGLSFLMNAKVSTTRAQTVMAGLQQIRQRAVQNLNSAIASGAKVQSQRDAFASMAVLPYMQWRSDNYPRVFNYTGDYDVFASASFKASEAFFHLYWDSVNYATPGVSPRWDAEATDACGQSVSYLRDIGGYIVRARAVSIGVPILGDENSLAMLESLLERDVMSRLVDLQIAEYGKGGCYGTLADLNGLVEQNGQMVETSWPREQINHRAPKAIGAPDTDNRAAEWFSDLMGMNDIGPWVHAARYPED